MPQPHPSEIDKHAWADAVIETVAPGVHRIPVQMPGDALRATNVYAMVGEKSVGLVDAGWFAGDAMGDLSRGLHELGAELGDISDIVVTHIHADHYTLAVELMRQYGCRVHLGRGERRWLENMDDTDGGRTAWTEALVRSGVPRADIRLEPHADHGPQKYSAPTDWITDGAIIRLGDLEVEAIETPGHTRGHVCFASAEGGVVFTGDHVLPRITPSIGFEPTDSEHRSLIDYLASLSLLRSRPDALMLPAHGAVRAGVHERVDELLHHHAVRLEQCGNAVASGARSAYEVAADVPWTSRGSALAQLGHMDQMMAVLETRAHLEVLDRRGEITRSDDNGVEVYALT